MILFLSEWLCDKKKAFKWYNMLSCTVHLVRKKNHRGTSRLIRGIFICCPFFLYSRLKFVVMMSGGIIRQVNQSEGRSARMSRFGIVVFIMVMAKWFNTALWLRVNLPSFRAIGHQFSMCSNELGHLHISYFLFANESSSC